MKLNTPIRRLEGVSYWVIKDPKVIHDFINAEIRKEWEADARSEGRDPGCDQWLKTLSERKWNLRVIETRAVKLNPDIMNYVDNVRGYIFSQRLEERSDELQQSIQKYGLVIWPLIVKGEDMQLVDGYCRYTVLRRMHVSRTYAYLGTLQSPKHTLHTNPHIPPEAFHNKRNSTSTRARARQCRWN